MANAFLSALAGLSGGGALVAPDQMTAGGSGGGGINWNAVQPSVLGQSGFQTGAGVPTVNVQAGAPQTPNALSGMSPAQLNNFAKLVTANRVNAMSAQQKANFQKLVDYNTLKGMNSGQLANFAKLVQGNAAPKTGTQSASATAAGGESLQQVLNAISGAAPQEAQVAAPTPYSLSDFFSTTPYTQALGRLNAGMNAASTVTKGSFGTAAQNLATLTAQAQQAQSAQNAAVAAQNKTLGAQQAQELAAAGGAGKNSLLGQNLTALAGTLAGQQAAQNVAQSQINQVQNNDLMGDKQTLSNEQAAALAYLASQGSSETGKINDQELSDQQTAQQNLLKANADLQSQYATAQAGAQKDYQSALSSYQSNQKSLLQSAISAVSASEGTGRDGALDQATAWVQQGGTEGALLSTAFNAAIKDNNQSQAIAAIQGAKTLTAAQKAQLTPVVQQYYNTSKQAPSQSDLINYLVNTYGGV